METKRDVELACQEAMPLQPPRGVTGRRQARELKVSSWPYLERGLRGRGRLSADSGFTVTRWEELIRDLGTNSDGCRE